MLEAGVDHRRMCGEEFLLVFFLTSLHIRAAIGPAGDWRPRLHRQTVEREVGWCQLDRGCQVLAPRPIEMRRQRENQVERNILDPGAAKGREGVADLLSVVGSMHPFERPIIEALRAEGYAIDAGVNPVGDGEVVNVVGVRLDRYFRLARDCAAKADGVEHLCYSGSAKPRWSPAAEVDGGKDRAGQFLTKLVQFRAQGGEVFIDRGAGADGDRKIAVRAAPGAERNVDVEMADGHARIYPPGRNYRRRISPAREHSTNPMISSDVIAPRHSASVRLVAAGSRSDCTNPPTIASQTFCSESGSSGGGATTFGADTPRTASASSVLAMRIAPSRINWLEPRLWSESMGPGTAATV